MTTETLCKCPTCGGDAMMGWSGLELVANSGDETLATQYYKSVSLDVGAEDYKSALRKAIHEEYKVGRLTSNNKVYFLKLMDTTNLE